MKKFKETKESKNMQYKIHKTPARYNIHKVDTYRILYKADTTYVQGIGTIENWDSVEDKFYYSEKEAQQALNEILKNQ